MPNVMDRDSCWVSTSRRSCRKPQREYLLGCGTVPSNWHGDAPIALPTTHPTKALIAIKGNVAIIYPAVRGQDILLPHDPTCTLARNSVRSDVLNAFLDYSSTALVAARQQGILSMRSEKRGQKLASLHPREEEPRRRRYDLPNESEGRDGSN